MDDLDRLYRRLVHNIRASRPEYLEIPFTVRELYEQLVPYRHNRRELAIETNQDYEVAVARLVSGERGYVHADATMQDVLQGEIESPTGDPGIFKEYAEAQISLAPVAEGARTPVPQPVPQAAPAARNTSADPPAATPPSTPPSASVTAAFDALAPSASVPSAAPSQAPSLLSSLGPMDVPTGCRFCGGTLPEGREANYCPHCGENLRTRRCPACGAEMDTAWRFCVSCGRKSA